MKTSYRSLYLVAICVLSLLAASKVFSHQCLKDPVKMTIQADHEAKLENDYNIIIATTDSTNPLFGEVVHLKYLHDKMEGQYVYYRKNLGLDGEDANISAINAASLTEKQLNKLCDLGTYYGNFNDHFKTYLDALFNPSSTGDISGLVTKLNTLYDDFTRRFNTP